MGVGSKLHLFRVSNEHGSISAVADTVTLSFAQDPLIKWLRPHAPPWARDQPETYRWQYRRIQTAVAQGIVLRSASPSQILQIRPAQAIKSSDPDTTGKGGTVASDGRSSGVSKDAGVAVILFPPEDHLKWTLDRIILTCKLRLLDILNPVKERGSNTKRLEKLMATHDEAIARIKKEYEIRNLWYLEVVAVHPTLQGRGVGKKAMGAVLDFIQHEPIVLECTSETNIAFYQKLGFEVVKEIELVKDGEAVKLWFMLRKPSKDMNTMTLCI